MDGKYTLNNPTKNLRDYLSIQGVILPENIFRTTNTENVQSTVAQTQAAPQSAAAPLGAKPVETL